MLIMGILMVTGLTNNINGYLSGAGMPDTMVEENIEERPNVGVEEPEVVEEVVTPAPNFTLMDQNGNYHTLSDYKGKNGKAPLENAIEWKKYDKNGIKGVRETSTMPGSAGSSWYFLRYIDPENDNEFANQELLKHSALKTPIVVMKWHK